MGNRRLGLTALYIVNTPFSGRACPPFGCGQRPTRLLGYLDPKYSKNTSHSSWPNNCQFLAEG